MSLLQPSFVQRLADPSIRTILLAGCGGGFDFVHTMLLYPELKAMGKRLIIGSYSFGSPEKIEGQTETVFQRDLALVKRVSGDSIPPPHYGPEVYVSSFLDARYPDDAPHFVYAYNARRFSIPNLRDFYSQIIAEHQIDAIVLVDGGSDSLMVGDEEGLGDPIEDAVSVAAVADLEGLKEKILLSISLGTDRYLHVSDASSLRAVAELTRSGGFLGSVSIEPASAAHEFYKACIQHIYQRQTFRSVHVGMIMAAIEGFFAAEAMPPELAESRASQEHMFIWPVMAVLWAFDINAVDQRSQLTGWLRQQEDLSEYIVTLFSEREKISLHDVENLPRHEDMRKPGTYF